VFDIAMQNIRAPLKLFALAIVLVASPADAQNLPWCATLDSDGSTQCSYYNEQQCQETVSGVGGECTPNPSAGQSAPTLPLPSAGPGSPMDLDPGPPPGLDGSMQQQRVGVPNNLFTTAGFIVKYATTPEKRAILRSLPPDKLVKRTKDGRLYYVYADAAGCSCAYVGTAQAYAAYQNGPNDPSFGGGGHQSNGMEMIDSDVGGPYISADIYPSMDSILDPSF
jgi:Protein of unknown function (DUF3551)